MDVLMGPAQGKTIKMKLEKIYLIVAGILFVVAIFLIINNVTNLTGSVVSSTTCIDTDNGIDKYTTGTVTYTRNGRTGVYTDYCSDQRRQEEYYCDANNKMRTKRHICDKDCVDGACPKTWVTCTDSDGLDYYTAGKACIGNDCTTDICIDLDRYVSEAYCINETVKSEKIYKCENGCSNGVCAQ